MIRYTLLTLGFVLLIYFITTVTVHAEPVYETTTEDIKPEPKPNTAPCTADERIEAWTFDYG